MTDETPGFTVKRRGVIGSARANFSCNSATCRTKKGARVYELPTATTTCPVCRSRKIQRLMSAPGLSKGIAKRTDAMMGTEHQRQQRQRDDAKTAQRNAPMLGASLKNGVAGALKEGMEKMGYAGHAVPWAPDPAGKSRPSGANAPHIAGIKAAGAVRVVPSSVQGKWNPTPAEMAEARRRA